MEREYYSDVRGPQEASAWKSVRQSESVMQGMVDVELNEAYVPSQSAHISESTTLDTGPMTVTAPALSGAGTLELALPALHERGFLTDYEIQNGRLRKRWEQ